MKDKRASGNRAGKAASTRQGTLVTRHPMLTYQAPSESTGLQLWWASNALLRTIRKAIEPTGMTHAQMILLANLDYLNQEEVSVSQRKLCRFSTMDENMVSQVVRTMVKKGWINRLLDPSDKRAHTLETTPEGREQLAQALALSRPATQAFFARLGDSKDLFTELLRELNQKES